MMFVDTNYFLRYLLNDVSGQSLKVKKLFLAGSEGKISLTTSLIVLFEVFWVLRSFYSLNKTDCVLALRNIMKLSFIKLSEREIFEDALALFEKKNLDLEDCYNVFYAKSQKATSFKTFDKKLEKEFEKLE